MFSLRWYVKWWDKFPHTQAIVSNVTKEFPSPNTLLAIKINTPMQKAEIAYVLASTSAKTVKSFAKPRKKGSPLDEIDRKSTRLNSSHRIASRMPSSA